MKNRMITLVLAGACMMGAGLRANDSSALYLIGGLDGKMLTNQDANNYFHLDGQQIGPQGYPSAVVHLGFQMGPRLAVEASANFGPLRSNEVTYHNGLLGSTRDVKTRWALTTYSLTPALTWVGSGYVNLLGLRLGLANLAGHVEDDSYGSGGSYDQEAQSFDGGLIFRSTQIVADHFSIGLEFGYDLTMFNNIKNKNGSGNYDPPQSPERNFSNSGHNGDQTTLDFSGGHIALVMGFWSNIPSQNH